MKKFAQRALSLGVITSLLVLAATGCGQTTSAGNGGQSKNEVKYPTKPVEVVVGYAAGGATDIATRLMTPYMEKSLGQAFTVVNKPGGGAEIAYTDAAKAKPDGYTLGIINSPTVIAIPLSHKTNYKVEDFAVIGNVAFDENVIAVKAGGPYKTLEDLIDKAKNNPGQVTLGHSGPYADDHLASLTFQQAANIKLKDTAFQGSAPSIVSVIGGHIDAVVCNVADVVEQVKQGQVAVLATMGEKRNKIMPNVPTLKEKGFDVLMGSYRALAAPANTPPEILEKLRDALKQVAENPEYIKKSEEAQQPVTYINAADFTKILQKDQEKLTKLWKDLNLPNQ